MTKEEFDKMSFNYEILPSGRININNSKPFKFNGSNTICCWSGKYLKTTEYKLLSDLLSTAKIDLLENL